MHPYRLPRLTRRDVARAAALVSALPAAAVPAAADGKKRDILAGSLSESRLASLLTPRSEWKPYPPASDRAAWEALPADLRQAIVSEGERQLKTEWHILPATLLLEFRRIGNRSHYEAARSRRRAKLQSLVVAECVEAKGRFLDEIVNGIWLTCEESYWGVPAHLGAQKAGSGLPDITDPTVDLFAAETSAELSWILYLLGPGLDTVSPLVRPRIHLEIDQRILTPTLKRDDIGWMGFRGGGRPPNNWNPWIASNWIVSALLTERDEKRRAASVHKALRAVDNFLNGYEDDGGCDEGPGYWNVAGGSLFDCMELVYLATGGQLSYYDVPLVKEIGRYIYRAHIAGEWYTNFADASARVHLSGDMVYRYGRRIQDEKMMGLGAWAVQKTPAARPPGGVLLRQLPALFNLGQTRSARAFQPLVRDVWLSGVQVMAARRQEGSPAGLYLAAQGGHNAESHNHNDVGNFIVYADGEPLVIDVGVETYSAKTFSPRRYEIWTMQSAYHNLPTIDGKMQKEGREYAARQVDYRASDDAAELTLDIARAWTPDSGLEEWLRTLRLDRAKNEVIIRDRFRLKNPAGEITLTLMTAAEPKAVSGGMVAVPARKAQIHFDAARFTPRIEEIKIEDGRLRSSWGERVWRILLAARNPGASGDWTVRIGQTS